MDKQIVVCPYNGLLLGNKEEEMAESQNNYTGWKEPDLKKIHIMIPFV